MSLPLIITLFAILQKYDFSSKSQLVVLDVLLLMVVCDTAKVRFFKQITTDDVAALALARCLRYCKSTIFQANHNLRHYDRREPLVVCDTAKVRFFKQITTLATDTTLPLSLFAILQKYDFSSKSQLA